MQNAVALLQSAICDLHSALCIHSFGDSTGRPAHHQSAGDGGATAHRTVAVAPCSQRYWNHPSHRHNAIPHGMLPASRGRGVHLLAADPRRTPDGRSRGDTGRTPLNQRRVTRTPGSTPAAESVGARPSGRAGRRSIRYRRLPVRAGMKRRRISSHGVVVQFRSMSGTRLIANHHEPRVGARATVPCIAHGR